MKISVELDDRDWGKVALAVQHALNWTRNQADGARGSYNSADRAMRLAKDVATLARIRTELKNQRSAGKPSRKVLAKAARDMKADMYGENGNG